jgi:hypothetical protein
MPKTNNSRPNPRIHKGKKTKAKISFTYPEVDIILQTMGQMGDDLSYYNFIPQPYRGKLLAAYDTATEKLEAAKQSLHRPPMADQEYKFKGPFKTKD